MALHTLPCEICSRLATCVDGSHPGLVAELDTGWAILGDRQWWPGYTLLLCKSPVTELHELSPVVRLRHLEELAQLAEAVCRVVRPHKLNYELLGNSVPHVHWHLFPRRVDEPDPTSPVWTQLPTPEEDAAHRLDRVRHDGLRRALAVELAAIRGARRP